MKALDAAFKLILLLIHLWTVVIAYTYSGFWIAVLSFFIPGSEFYWAYRMWGALTLYSVTVIVFVVIGGALRGIVNVLLSEEAEA